MTIQEKVRDYATTLKNDNNALGAVVILLYSDVSPIGVVLDPHIPTASIGAALRGLADKIESAAQEARVGAFAPPPAPPPALPDDGGTNGHG